MRALEFIRGHVTLKLPYNFSCQMTTPIVVWFNIDAMHNATFILETRYDLFFQPSWYFSTHDLFIIAQALSSCWQTTASATHYALMMMYLTRKEIFFSNIICGLQLNHSMFLECWNTAKSLFKIEQHFSYLPYFRE